MATNQTLHVLHDTPWLQCFRAAKKENTETVDGATTEPTVLQRCTAHFIEGCMVQDVTRGAAPLHLALESHWSQSSHRQSQEAPSLTEALEAKCTVPALSGAGTEGSRTRAKRSTEWTQQ